MFKYQFPLRINCALQFKEIVAHILSVAVCYVLHPVDEILNLAVLKVATLAKRMQNLVSRGMSIIVID